MKKITASLTTIVLSTMLSLPVFAVGVGANVDTNVSVPGVSGRTGVDVHTGVERQGKVPHGWSKGKKTGWHHSKKHKHGHGHGRHHHKVKVKTH